MQRLYWMPFVLVGQHSQYRKLIKYNKMTILKTLKRIDQFETHAKNYLEKNVELKKFTYALNKVIKDIAKRKIFKKHQDTFAEHREKLADAETLHASVDAKGNLIRDDKGIFSYTPEQHNILREKVIALNKDWKNKEEELANEEFEVEPFLVSDENIPDGLTIEELECFQEFVIRDNYIEDALALLDKKPSKKE